jgi:hypothetical protein
VGRCKVVDFGTYLTEAVTDVLASEFFDDASVVTLVPNVPKGIEVALREGEGRSLLFTLMRAVKKYDTSDGSVSARASLPKFEANGEKFTHSA